MRRGTRGFTLVEVVIALTLVSLIMLGLVAALSTFGSTSARMEARSEHADDMRLVSAFLRQTLGAASVKHLQQLDDGDSVPYFLGSATALEWLAPMPARHGVGGLHRLRLSLREEPDGMDLVLQLIPFVPPAPLEPPALPDWSAESTRILVRGVEHFSLAYQRLGRDDWQAEWVDPEVLPGRIAVHIDGEGGAWPELIVAVLEAEMGTALNDGGVLP